MCSSSSRCRGYFPSLGTRLTCSKKKTFWKRQYRPVVKQSLNSRQLQFIPWINNFTYLIISIGVIRTRAPWYSAKKVWTREQLVGVIYLSAKWSSVKDAGHWSDRVIGRLRQYLARKIPYPKSLHFYWSVQLDSPNVRKLPNWVWVVSLQCILCLFKLCDSLSKQII